MHRGFNYESGDFSGSQTIYQRVGPEAPANTCGLPLRSVAATVGGGKGDGDMALRQSPQLCSFKDPWYVNDTCCTEDIGLSEHLVY